MLLQTVISENMSTNRLVYLYRVLMNSMCLTVVALLIRSGPTQHMDGIPAMNLQPNKAIVRSDLHQSIINQWDVTSVSSPTCKTILPPRPVPKQSCSPEVSGWWTHLFQHIGSGSYTKIMFLSGLWMSLGRCSSHITYSWEASFQPDKPNSCILRVSAPKHCQAAVDSKPPLGDFFVS